MNPRRRRVQLEKIRINVQKEKLYRKKGLGFFSIIDGALVGKSLYPNKLER